MHGVINSFSQTTSEEQKKKQSRQLLRKRDGETQNKTNTTLGFTRQLDCLVKPTP